jgi:hypothetical protein
MTARKWKVEIEFHETDRYTHADALLETGNIDYRSFGRARCNPLDANQPRIGEEIAAARALESLVLQLQGLAERDIEAREGHHVEIRV